MAIEVQSWNEAAQQVVSRQLTDEEYIAEFGEESLSFLKASVKPETEMTEGERYLARKMQAEQGVNDAAADAGVDSIFDLPSHDDDESIPLDDLEPREYDFEGAATDLEARQAR